MRLGTFFGDYYFSAATCFTFFSFFFLFIFFLFLGRHDKHCSATVSKVKEKVGFM
jgi:hypothetical protein